jgi:glycosyltransferase involved in cell wall biosynthesis
MNAHPDSRGHNLPQCYLRLMPTRRKIVWIPHDAWEHCQGQRPRLLVEALRKRFEIHVITWESRPRERAQKWFYVQPSNHWRAIRTFSQRRDGVTVHHAAVPLPMLQRLAGGYPPRWSLALSELLFQRSLRRLHRRWQFDAAVVSSSHHFTGYPPLLPGIPTVFDYVDTSPPDVEEHYVRMASRVVTVSHYLADRVRSAHGLEPRVIPNGLHISRLAESDRARGRAKWGLEGRRVVSLIGLTCSPRLYFLDALACVKSEFSDLVFLGVGGGRRAEALERRCRELGIPAVMTGWVDPAEVSDLFAATDVGLYPGDDNIYYDGACPLKVLEYTGARVPMVVNRCAELVRLGFESLVIRPATIEGFADGLREALRSPTTRFPNLTAYDWSHLGQAFGDEIDMLSATRVTHSCVGTQP